VAEAGHRDEQEGHFADPEKNPDASACEGDARAWNLGQGQIPRLETRGILPFDRKGLIPAADRSPRFPTLEPEKREPTRQRLPLAEQALSGTVLPRSPRGNQGSARTPG
jgi:hypothetical protein